MSPRPLPPSLGGPSPRRRWTVPCLVPAGTRSFLRPCSVGTSISAPRMASGIVSGTSTSRLSPLALKTGEPHARAVLDAGRDVDPVALDGAHRAAALAGRARVVDDGAGPAALRARLGDREQALALALDAAPLAARA